MSIPVGITMPKMLPITATWTLPFTGYLLFLHSRVTKIRVNSNKWLGNQSTEPKIAGDKDGPDPLEVAVRCLGNYVENIPMALMIAAIVELNGGHRRILNGGLAALFISRLIHVECGMLFPNTCGIGRPIGYFGTTGFLASMSTYAAYLVKGYWGF